MVLRRSRQTTTAEQRADPATARSAAVALLARRDFASAELHSRLCTVGFDPDTAGAVIAELCASGVVNDRRFAENYVSWHAGRGQGPIRIAAELRRRGLSEARIDAALATRPDWPALARRARRGKFGPQAPSSWAERARQARFLQYRGFSSDHIRAATGADPDLD
jgi:regulatory protein